MPGSSANDLLITMDQAAASAGGTDWMGLVFMGGAMLAIMYFLMIRPQQREKAAREELLNSLTKGDDVVTAGGLHGKIIIVEADIVKVDIGGKGYVTVDKSAITRKAGDPPPADKK
ncbi:MAG: preprotein translocase subunit YajC [Deltaproteobacteria bacterium]|nr:MAG: preprotein translocase subunit YajC [Deltaproteobacteria bacterium]